MTVVIQNIMYYPVPQISTLAWNKRGIPRFLHVQSRRNVEYRGFFLSAEIWLNRNAEIPSSARRIVEIQDFEIMKRGKAWRNWT